MLIARTKEESDRFVELEESHILRLEDKPKLYRNGGFVYLIDSVNCKLAYIPEQTKQRTIKTKKYGVLCLFERVSDFIESRYNKAVIAVYCGNVYQKKTKRTINKVVCLSTEEESFEIEDREFSNSGGIYLNNIEQIEALNAYLCVIERNRYANNSIQIINVFNLKTK